jgi:hypothetical protein
MKSAREWFESKHGKSSHGVSQFKLMEDYAKYYNKVKRDIKKQK